MRKIIFRGKDKETQSWVYGDLFQADNGKYKKIAIWPPDLNMPITVDADTVGQFMNFIDKNGVEIFEGDIVSGIIPNNNIPENHIVRFTRIDEFNILRSLRNIEVVGNIYDNPEMMQKLWGWKK